MSKLLPALSNDHQVLLDKSIRTDWSTPEYKLKHFVGGSHIHPLHKVKQYMLELNTRQEHLETYEREIQKYEFEIELEQEKKEVARFNAEKKICDLEIQHLELKIKVAKEKLRTFIRDRDKFLKLIDEFNNSAEGRDEQGRRYIDLMDDPEEYEKIEKQYWEYRLAKQASLDMVAYGRIGVGNMDAILQLDADSQQKCIAMAYETLILNETRMVAISDAVHQRLQNGQTVSDIHKLLNMGDNPVFPQLQNQESVDVPRIQKR